MATYQGGMLAWGTTYRLYGDGRLRVTISDPGSQARVWEEYEIFLSREKIEALLSPLVESGVMEFDYEKKKEELRLQQRLIPIASDAPSFILILNLDNYIGPGSPKGGPASHMISVHALHLAEQYLQDVPELMALRRTQKALASYGKLAKGANQVSKP
ncbi:MAG: hypothetical protein HC897_01310 [Thermoanaerobaculia bacterium]|nr:hypothetical protein [Thermoanaerobaculia bacterium]